MRLRERFQRFMYGRYGMDGLGQCIMWMALICIMLSWFVDGPVFHIASLALLVWGYFRMFSRNTQKRYQENSVYYRFVEKIKNFFRRQKSYIKQSRTHHIFKCPQCKQKIRIPRGKGKVAIRCQRCGTEFIKNSR